jgi:hypothetical protein
MSNGQDEARFREHMALMRQATRGLGRDFVSEFSELDDKIERFGRSTGQGAANLGAEIQEGLSNLGKSIDEEARKLPGRISGGVSRAGAATWGAVSEAGRRTKEGTKNALAAAAGVNRKPMKSWSPPGDASAVDEGRP